MSYQIIEGSCIPVAGIHVIDDQILQVAEISKHLWNPKYFASYLLFLKLASSETIKKLTDIIMIDEDPEEVGSLCNSLYLLRLGLYAANTKFLDANIRVSFL